MAPNLRSTVAAESPKCSAYAAHMQRICSARRHCAAVSGSVWQRSDGREAGVEMATQVASGAELGAQDKGPAAVTVGPLIEAGDEIRTHDIHVGNVAWQ